MEPMRFFRVMEKKSDYVGSEKVITHIGVFYVQIDYSQGVDLKGRNGLEKRSAVKLLYAAGTPLRIGDGFCAQGEDPEYIITSITEYPEHCIAEAELWKST